MMDEMLLLQGKDVRCTTPIRPLVPLWALPNGSVND